MFFFFSALSLWLAPVVVVVAAKATPPPPPPPCCPLSFASASIVRIGVLVPSRPASVDRRDAARRTWCRTALSIGSVGVRFVVGEATVVEAEDIAVVPVVDAPANCSAKLVLALGLSTRLWPDATHVARIDDDAFVFVDRLAAELAAGHAMTQPLGTRAPPRRVALQPTFVWGYFMRHGEYGDWPFPVGYGFVATVDLVHAVVAAHETVPFEFGDTCDGIEDALLLPGGCLKDRRVIDDVFFGLVILPYAYQRVHDRRFHVLVGLDHRSDHTPAYPVSDTSIVVDLHGLDKAAQNLDVSTFFDAMHRRDYDRLNSFFGCALPRVECDSAEKLPTPFTYTLRVDARNWYLRVPTCAALRVALHDATFCNHLNLAPADCRVAQDDLALMAHRLLFCPRDDDAVLSS
ncbi:hypothetical protein CTAYLR_005332 [Chrysophaeum taylorii]|uniref:Hexosyltransferase n=1 Tax=Chrysophaeum taylorii TaxID=2483200 RepID=A0AAD7XFG9_9STRA|nr:hypothetical protein CTAYLR_005332 [Chrysophaeum taylorii]